jgi:hypothetical protein
MWLHGFEVIQERHMYVATNRGRRNRGEKYVATRIEASKCKNPGAGMCSNIRRSYLVT